MNHFSKIDLIGRVGAVHEATVGNERHVRFSVGVDDVYRGGAGATVKTTWFNCSYWGNAVIERGQDIHLEGHIIGNDYIDLDGRSRQALEIKVNRIW